MRIFCVVFVFLVILGINADFTEASDQANVASLDAETFVVTNGASVYLLKVKSGKVMLQDAILLYTRQEGTKLLDYTDTAIIVRQKIEMK